MLGYSYIKDSDDAEQMFQKCLMTGATCYAVVKAKLSGKLKRVVEAYRPLLSRLVGRQWVLEPHPLEMPNGVKANIFKGRKNDYYITVLSTRMTLQRTGQLIFKVSIKDVKCLSKVCYWGPATGSQKAPFTLTDGTAEIILPRHKVASLVKLSIGTDVVRE